MAFRTLRTNSRGLFKTKDAAENPELLLKLTTKCLKKVDRTVSLGAATSPKFNQEQCKYLAHKLKVAVQSARSLFEPIKTWYSKFASDEDRAQSLEILYLLFVLSKEVESFILGCSKSAWIQSAIMLANVSEHTSSLSFDLEVCTIAFSNSSSSSKIFGAALSGAAVTRIRRVEGEIVEEKFKLDQLRLYKDVSALIQSSKSSSAARQQATFLYERLRSLSRKHSRTDSPESDHSSCPEINLSNLKRTQELGKGATGIVHKANWLGIEVARKTFHGPASPYFEQEIKILEELCHPNIVSLLWHTRDKRNCYMVMELMDGDLSSFMQERLEEHGSGDPPMSILEGIHIMLQVAEGMLFLHGKKIVHRDLKSANILVKQMKARGVEVKYLQAKVADFGLSRTKERSRTYSNQTPNQGTTRWMPPEVMKIVNNDGEAELSKVHDKALKHPFKVDVYSFGIVFSEVLTGELPFPTLTPNEVKIEVLGGARPCLPDHCPDRLRNMIEACWSSDPTKRPGFGEICAELRHMKCAYLITSALISAESDLKMTAEQVSRATQSFSGLRKIGEGSMSTVYRGVLPTSTAVAVKRLAIRRGDINERLSRGVFEGLGHIQHPSLVKVLGYCCSSDVTAIVTEYMPNGTLSNVMYGHCRDIEIVTEFNWNHRFDTAIGIAMGLKYLHCEFPTSVSQGSFTRTSFVHGDLKASNILFNSSMEARIADFGTNRLLSSHGLGVGASIAYGYTAPELAESTDHGGTIKGDVYSFGIILLEMISGRSPRSLAAGQRLPQWIRASISNSTSLDNVLDSNLISELRVLQPLQEQIGMVLGVALLCTREDPGDRPYMTDVLDMLNDIKTRFQDEPKPEDGTGPQGVSRPGSARRLLSNLSAGSSKFLSSLSAGSSKWRSSLSNGSSKWLSSLSDGSSCLGLPTSYSSGRV
ncbi:hypothetical protein M758_6G049300 [Ceratodon purpureus]|nr:hypothetical protein M758_6G049300 [Ceratodon purpureus]